jgi:hypothetical protein
MAMRIQLNLAAVAGVMMVGAGKQAAIQALTTGGEPPGPRRA